MCWVPREQNAEADAITNGDYSWLSPEKRVATQVYSLPFEVLPALLSHGAAFYEGSETVNVIEEEKGPKDVRSLRARDGWG